MPSVSIHCLKSGDAWTHATFAGRPACCFFCGKDINDVGVAWNGHASDAAHCILIVCHPQCATDLGTELIGDARTAQRLLTGKPLTAGIDTSLIAPGEA